MLTEILTYLTVQKVIILGAAATISELIIIIVNTYRKIKANTQSINTFMAVDARTEGIFKPHPNIKGTFLWSVNPMNLFRKP